MKDGSGSRRSLRPEPDGAPNNLIHTNNCSEPVFMRVSGTMHTVAECDAEDADGYVPGGVFVDVLVTSSASQAVQIRQVYGGFAIPFPGFWCTTDWPTASTPPEEAVFFCLAKKKCHAELAIQQFLMGAICGSMYLQDEESLDHAVRRAKRDPRFYDHCSWYQQAKYG